jgi:cytochrome c-type biogenesis protein CcmH/NrfG
MYFIKIVSLCGLLLFSSLSAAIAMDTTEAPAEDRRVLLERYAALLENNAAQSNDQELQDQYLKTVLALGYYDLAAAHYEKTLASTPDDMDITIALAEAWIKTGPYGVDKAFDVLKKAVANDDKTVEARMVLANLYHREGLYVQAAALYDEILSLAPQHVRARLGKAVLQVRSGEISDASSVFNAIGADALPYDVETRLMLRKALDTFEHRGGWVSDTAENHAAYAKLLYRAGRITDAVLAARRAVTIAPGDFETWNFIAAMQLQVGNLQQAEQAYAKSLEANGDQPDIATQRRQIIDELTRRTMNQKP